MEDNKTVKIICKNNLSLILNEIKGEKTSFSLTSIQTLKYIKRLLYYEN